MLKRTQILLEEWQVEHYRATAQKYDVSFSEMIRMALCLDIITATHLKFPKYKLQIADKMLKKTIKVRSITETMTAEQFHKCLSTIYFEARKAVELWTKSAKANAQPAS